MKVLAELAEAGFVLKAEGDSISYEYRGTGQPDPEKVTPLLQWLRDHKPEVLRALRERPPATLAQARQNAEAVSPGCTVRGPMLSPEGWRLAFALCPPGEDRERLVALWQSGSIEAEQRDGVLFLIVHTPESATVTIKAGDSRAAQAVMVAFGDPGAVREGDFDERPSLPAYVDDQSRTWAYNPALNVAFCRETGERRDPSDLGADFNCPHVMKQ